MGSYNDDFILDETERPPRIEEVIAEMVIANYLLSEKSDNVISFADIEMVVEEIEKSNLPVSMSSAIVFEVANIIKRGGQYRIMENTMSEQNDKQLERAYEIIQLLDGI